MLTWAALMAKSATQKLTKAIDAACTRMCEEGKFPDEDGSWLASPRVDLKARWPKWCSSRQEAVSRQR